MFTSLFIIFILNLFFGPHYKKTLFLKTFFFFNAFKVDKPAYLPHVQANNSRGTYSLFNINFVHGYFENILMLKSPHNCGNI